MRRVVVTGLGAVTPVGNDIPAFWENLLAGKNGIGPLSRFDAGEYKAKVAAQVKDFDPLQYMEKGEIRKSDLFCQYAMAAACQAVEDSGIFGKVAPERFRVYFGSGIGGLITMSAELQKLLEKGPKRVSPFFIPMMIANMAAGNIAIRFEAKGPCLPVTTACATSTNEVGKLSTPFVKDMRMLFWQAVQKRPSPPLGLRALPTAWRFPCRKIRMRRCCL